MPFCPLTRLYITTINKYITGPLQSLFSSQRGSGDFFFYIYTMRIYLEDDDGHVLKIKFQTPAKHIVGGLPRPEFVLSLRIVACDDIFP